MGWSSGSVLFSDVIRTLKEEIPDEAKREQIYAKLIPAFQDQDWDTEDECMDEDPAYDAALRKLHPDLYEG